MIYNFGDKKSKESYGRIFENYYKMTGPFEAMFSKFDSDYFNKFYQEAYSNMIHYYQNTYKTLEKFINISIPAYKATTDSADTLPANGHDIYNYFARYGIADFQIQAVLDLDGRLDFDRLLRTVRLSVDTEPILGCRFIEDDPPYWIRFENIDDTMFCSIEETDDPDKAVKRFLESPLDMDKDPMVKVKLIRSNQNDSLCIKVNHACSDATGLKDYIQLLSHIYSNIDEKNDGFILHPGTRSRKDQDRLFSELGISDLEAAWIPGSEISTPTWRFPWKHNWQHITRVKVSQLPYGQLDIMSNYAKNRGATINDLILTAFYRSMLQMGKPIYDKPMEVDVTVDLRRYLPNKKAEAIRNFSGSETARISMIESESFDETLSRIVSMMTEIKSRHPGLQSAIGLERIEKISFKEACKYFKVIPQFTDIISKYIIFYGDKCLPVLSNVGFISKDLIKFGQHVVTNAYIVPPLVRAPGLLLMVSSYSGLMSLAVCYYESVVSGENIERLLNNIKTELTEGCKL